MLNEINFDTMTADELMAFWSRYRRPTRKDAVELCGRKFPGYTGVASSAANYACNLAVARRCRERGDETAAKCYDYAAQISLRDIPPALRPS